jgi:hypothetical protein
MAHVSRANFRWATERRPLDWRPTDAAACDRTAGQTSLVFSLRARKAGVLEENFQNDTGSNPDSPGTATAGNLKLDIPAGAHHAIGGPPPVPSGSYFRSIATLVFATSKQTASINIVTLVNGTTGRCTMDGVAGPAAG